MDEEINITRQQFDNIIKLSGLDYSQDTAESAQETFSRAIIALERRLNYYDYSLSFFIAEATNVLIVDDTELSIFQLSTMLQKIGMNVYVARSKEEAYEEFKKKHFDYLILDIYMPD
ncbi:response regulator, partial [bacterium]|nr:response regulator [bacterium]